MNPVILRNMTHYPLSDHPATTIQSFLNDHQASSLSQNTTDYYRHCLQRFETFCTGQV